MNFFSLSGIQTFPFSIIIKKILFSMYEACLYLTKILCQVITYIGLLVMSKGLSTALLLGKKRGKERVLN